MVVGWVMAWTSEDRSTEGRQQWRGKRERVTQRREQRRGNRESQREESETNGV